MGYVISVDVGGTHTDCVASDGHGFKVSKVASTADLTQGVMDAIEIIANSYGISLQELISNCDRFVYGSTTATNIFVQHRLPKVGHLCTKGHRDSLWFRDGWKPDRWNLRYPPLWTLMPRYMRRPIEERMNYRGEELIPLNEAEVRNEAQFFRNEKVAAVAICFLWSYLHPSHEQRAKEILEEELPDIPVVISYDVLPTIREWERSFCTCLCAGILVEVREHLLSFRDHLRELGLKEEPLVMQCNGGHATIDMILRNPLSLIASGPTGGALAGVFFGNITGSKDVMTIDMGGTSLDVCVLPDKKIPIVKDKRLEYEPIAIPSVLIHTIGAGGGSIAWVDPGGALNVGPHSAGARPGPACYGLGGEEPTITDAYLVLGYISPDFFLGGRTKLYPELAQKVIEHRIAKPLNLNISSAASSIVDIQNNQMAAAMRLLSVQRGIDPRPFTLVVGGGAGPVQSSALARALGMRRIVIPRNPGAFCALGEIEANIIHNEMRPYTSTAADADLDRLSMLYEEMEASLIDMLIRENIPRERITLKRFIDTRYIGQVYELEAPVPLVEKLSPEHLAEILRRFEDAHDALYHFRMEGYPMEFMSCRTEAIGEVEAITLDELPFAGPDPSGTLKAKRKVYLPENGAFEEVNIYDGDKLEHGNILNGVAIVETQGSTLGVWKNDKLVVNKYGDFEIEIGVLGNKSRH